jgi:hypothetical protein
MTGIEALESAIIIAGKIEVKGKENLANLLYVIQVLEALKRMQDEGKGGNADGGADQKTVEG